MSFGNVFIRLCSLIAILSQCVANADVKIPDALKLESVETREVYNDYMIRFRECNDKSLRKNNPYPISDWLISLTKEKQMSVLIYLHKLTSYNCVLEQQRLLIETFRQNNELHALNVMEQQGWFEIPSYGQSVLSPQSISENIALTEEDRIALNLLIERNYLPFDGIAAGELLIKLREPKKE